MHRELSWRPQNAPKSFSAGALHRPRWGSSQHFPDPLVGWGGGYPLPIPHPTRRLDSCAFCARSLGASLFFEFWLPPCSVSLCACLYFVFCPQRNYQCMTSVKLILLSITIGNSFDRLWGGSPTIDGEWDASQAYPVALMPMLTVAPFTLLPTGTRTPCCDVGLRIISSA